MAAMAMASCAGVAAAPLRAASKGTRGSMSAHRRGPLRCNAEVAVDTTEKVEGTTFPFVKIVGQEELKLALILNVVVGPPSPPPAHTPRDPPSKYFPQPSKNIAPVP
jgi:hypothetical protein